MAAPVLEAQYTPEHISSIDENSGWDRAEKASVMSVENDVDFMSASTAEVFFPKVPTGITSLQARNIAVVRH